MAVKIQTNWQRLRRTLHFFEIFFSMVDLNLPWKHDIRKFDSNQNKKKMYKYYIYR